MTTNDNVRKQCVTARETDERNMNAQDRTLPSVTAARFCLARIFCGAQVYLVVCAVVTPGALPGFKIASKQAELLLF